MPDLLVKLYELPDDRARLEIIECPPQIHISYNLLTMVMTMVIIAHKK